MALKIYNSLTRKKEIFRPLEKGHVKMYVCGPTVYDFAHIGNFRTYVFEDLVRRYLEYKNYKVKFVMNITDVGHLTSDADTGEDKIEQAAKKQKKDPYQIAKFYEKVFLEDIEKLNIKKAHAYPRATEHIQEIIKLIKKLIQKKHAYIVNSNVYFDISTFPNYGKLSGNILDQLKTGARLEANPEKKHPADFALWLEDPKHLMNWKSPWGEHGYPGWHSECSAMVFKHLGEQIDIHAGGEDNKFPHHESEIAQSEGATGKQFVKYWLHTRHLLVDKKKMSKSKNNFYTLKDILDKNYSARALRYLLFSAHYRQALNFTWQSLKSAEQSLRKLDGFPDGKLDITPELDDDFNTPKALAKIFKSKKWIPELETIFGIKKLEIKIPEKIKKLVAKREKARKNKDYQESDKIRDKIKKIGFLVEDTPTGAKVSQKPRLGD